MRQGLIVESTAYGVGKLIHNQGSGPLTFVVDGKPTPFVADYIRVNDDGSVVITLTPEGICPVTGR